LLRDIPTPIHLKMLRLGAEISFYPWQRYCLQERIISLVQVIHMLQPNILKSNQATKTVSLTYTSK